MKYLQYLVGLTFILPLIVLCEDPAAAEEVAKAVVDPGKVAMAGDKFIEYLLKSLGGLKGLGALGIVGVASQLLMKALQVPFLGKMAGKWKLVVIYALNLIGGVVALRMGGMTIMPALLHANTLAAGSIMVHQVYKQFIVKRKEAPAA